MLAVVEKVLVSGNYVSYVFGKRLIYYSAFVSMIYRRTTVLASAMKQCPFLTATVSLITLKPPSVLTLHIKSYG